MYYFLVLMPFTLIHLFSFSRDPAQNPKGEHASEMLKFMHSASHSAAESTPDIFLNHPNIFWPDFFFFSDKLAVNVV